MMATRFEEKYDTDVRPAMQAEFSYPNVMEMPRIELALGLCDLFISIGTSGNVYPAAGFVDDVRRAGRARRVELNLEASDGARLFDQCIQGPASEVVPAFVDRLLAGEG